MNVPRRRRPGNPDDLGQQTKATSFQAFVSGVRFRRSLQEANPESILLKAAIGSGLSYQLVISYFKKTTTLTNRRAQRPRSRQISELLSRKRDLAIRMSHEAYRYLNLHQLEMLFFPSNRSAQIRPKQLKDFGHRHRWKIVEPPAITRRPSAFLLSPRGARVLAASVPRIRPPWAGGSALAKSGSLPVRWEMMHPDWIPGIPAR